ncbi:MAG: hypothetical protein J7498_05775 [Sphingobium sp.]|nr:hypothetical protein [Sphingobium sp.]
MDGRLPWLALCATLLVAATPPKDIAFVECPIVRDTKTVPCWLAEHKGKLYYLGIQTDVSAEFNPPSLGHKVLVEGQVTDAPTICGGIVLKPVKVSIMQERADDCNQLLPADDRYDLTFTPPRPPGPSAGRLAFDYAPPPPAPQPPFKPQSFDIHYDFNGTVGFSTPRLIQPVLKYAREVNARKIEITGLRGATRLDDGTLAIEDEAIAARRANQIADLLKGVGLTSPTYVVVAKDKYQVGDWTTRRVTVVVSP